MGTAEVDLAIGVCLSSMVVRAPCAKNRLQLMQTKACMLVYQL